MCISGLNLWIILILYWVQSIAQNEEYWFIRFVEPTDLVLFLLQHIFVAQTGLTRRLAMELLDKMNDPESHPHFSEVDDDDLEV